MAGALTLGGTARAEPSQAWLCQPLGCTDAQEDELRALVQEFRRDIRGDREAIGRLAKDAAKQLARSKPDEKQLDKIRTQISRHRAAMEKRAFQLVLEVHEQLDDAQRKKLAALIEEGGFRRLLGGAGGRKAQGSR